ncbi:MAG: flagellar hook-associated protein FlgL, partial [Firmicutes bacterium]|nr:flagellar hook-associated protein FlgL [Bacillota bacterium]
SQNLSTIDKYNTQLGTGKKVSRPSDDPSTTSLQMRLHSEMRRIEQHLENVDAGITWLENTDAALEEAGAVVHRLRDLAVEGANGALDQDALNAIADEVNGLLNHLVQVGNTNIGGKYIFAGTRTLVAPLQAVYDADGNVTGVQYKGDSGSVELEISAGASVRVNTAAPEVFFDVINAAINLRDRLLAGDHVAVSNSLGEIDAANDLVLRQRSTVGAKVNRLELTKSRLGETALNAERLLSNVESVDVAEVVMKLSLQQTVYEALLNVGSRVIQPTLLDFMK